MVSIVHLKNPGFLEATLLVCNAKELLVRSPAASNNKVKVTDAGLPRH